MSPSQPFFYSFKVDGTLEEAGSMEQSSSPYWWVNSGAQMLIQAGRGKTIQGDLPLNSKWQRAYALANPVDTDLGIHPQNIFRLLLRTKWQTFRQEMYFRITKDNLSLSTNRNASNGLLLFNRYQDGSNLYYAGLRVDGAVVVKKKINGVYYTMAYAPVFGTGYNLLTRPNLLPKNTWLGIASEISNNPNGTVDIKVFMDRAWRGIWQPLIQTTDDGISSGGPAILQEGYGGIRTDFMDVEFDSYTIREL